MLRFSAMDVFDALADPVRRDLLVRVADVPRSVTDLVREHAISRPAISRHLRILREAGLVTVTPAGRHRLHELNREALTPVGELLRALEPPMPPVAEHQLDALDLEVRRTVHERSGRHRSPAAREKAG